MKHRNGEIGKALADTTVQYKGLEHGVVAFITDELDHARSVEEIVQMMRMVARSKGDLFKGRATGKPHATKLGARFLQSVANTDMEQMRFHFPCHVFHPLFDLFDRLTVSFGVPQEVLCDADANMVNTCINGIRSEARSKAFKKMVNDHDRPARKNHASLTRYTKKLRSIYPALHGFRIDLSYRDQAWPFLGPAEFLAHRGKFLRDLRKLLPKRLLAGYAWRLQISERRLINVHVLILVDGQFAHETTDAFLDIKRRWEETVTSGTGLCVNRGHYQYQYKCPSEDKTSEQNLAAGELLRQVIIYMTLTDRYIKTTAPDNHRTFGKGVVPKKRMIRRSKSLQMQFIPGIDAPPTK